MKNAAALLAILMLASCTTTEGGDDDGDGGGDGKADGSGMGAPRNIPFSVSRHVWPPGAHGSDSQELLQKDLKLIAELGAKYVRTDVWWYVIEPSRGSYNEAALDYYRWFVEEAGRNGLGVVAILSGAPEWANDLYKQNRREEFTKAFGGYSEKVSAKIGDLITYWQLWNEPNNFLDLPNGETDIKLFREGKAGVDRGRAAIGAQQPYRTAVNVLVDGHDGYWYDWEGDIRYYMNNGARDVIDIISIDHYPGTWSVGDWGGNIVDRLFDLGKEQGKSVAIFELGYSTTRCTLPLNTEDGQVRWVKEQMPRLRSKLYSPGVTKGVKFELVNWFKIEDRNSHNCFDIEDNFGVVRTDRSKKPAFETLRAEIAKFWPFPQPQ
ncbi:MAG: family 1 glycosylhydrolase [Kofleriaceae bacterium]